MTEPRIEIEQGKAGLWYATSPDIPGLLVAEHTREALEAAVPKAIEALRRAREEGRDAGR